MLNLYNKYGNFIDFDHRIPDRAFQNYYGYTTTVNGDDFFPDDAFTTAAFSRHPDNEHVLVLGTDQGLTRVTNVKNFIVTEKNNLFEGSISSDIIYRLSHNLVHSLAFFQNSNKFAAGCGGGELFVCDAEEHYKGPVCRKTGHCIKQVATAPIGDEIFASVDAECVKIWDCRCVCAPKLTISNVANRKKLNMVCVTYLNSNTLAIAEGLPNGQHDLIPGISFWDLRYQKVAEPYLSLDVPPILGRVSSLGLSRDGNRLFAAGAKKYILEYYISGNTHPIRAYEYSPQGSYRSQIKMSPFSDHFLIGNRDEGALLYDFQDPENYPEDRLTIDNPFVKDNRHPRFDFPGKPVTEEFNGSWGLDWSVNGKYIVMIGLNSMTFWTNDIPEGVEFINKERTKGLINGAPIEFDRPKYTKEYQEQIMNPKQNKSIYLEDDETDHVVDLISQLKVNPKDNRKRSIQTRTNDENIPILGISNTGVRYFDEKEVIIDGKPKKIRTLTPLNTVSCDNMPAKRVKLPLSEPPTTPMRELTFYFKKPIVKDEESECDC